MNGIEELSVCNKIKNFTHECPRVFHQGSDNMFSLGCHIAKRFFGTRVSVYMDYCRGLQGALLTESSGPEPRL